METPEDEEEDSAEEEAAALSLWDEGYEGKAVLELSPATISCGTMRTPSVTYSPTMPHHRRFPVRDDVNTSRS